MPKRDLVGRGLLSSGVLRKNTRLSAWKSFGLTTKSALVFFAPQAAHLVTAVAPGERGEVGGVH